MPPVYFPVSAAVQVWATCCTSGYHFSVRGSDVWVNTRPTRGDILEVRDIL